MSRNARIELEFGDARYSFALLWGQLAELQEKTEAGPYVVLRRLYENTWRVEDISHTIRLGLIGGGMKPTEALTLVRRYVEARPPLENVLVAQAILSASLMGAPDEQPGEAEGEAEAPAEKESA